MQEVWVQFPQLGRFPGGGNGNPLQYFCLENCMDRGALWAIVYVAKSQTQLSDSHTHTVFKLLFHLHMCNIQQVNRTYLYSVAEKIIKKY